MNGKNLIEKLSKALDLEAEPIPGKPLIEILFNQAVLVENHCGVVSYSTEQVIIKTKAGYIIICGSELKLGRMSCEQLRICGIIDSVQMKGRKVC